MDAWDWNIIWQSKTALLSGALVAIALSFFSVALGTILGGVIAFAKKSIHLVIRILAILYIWIFRAIPFLVLLLWIHYGGPLVINVVLSAFFSAAIGLTINLSPFAAENIRAGLESVPKTQLESALALGLSRWQANKRIIIPQAVNNMLPNLMGQYITTIKMTSVASMIGVTEIVHIGGLIISINFKPFEIYTAIAVMYMLIIIPLELGLLWFEKWQTKRGGY